MRKILSFILSISIFASVMTVPMSAFAKDIDFLVAESYNEQITGTSPANGAIAAGAATVVVTKENKDKAVELGKSPEESGLLYNISSDDNNISMYVDLLYTNTHSYTEFYISDSENKSFVLAYINENGEIYSGDARLATGVPLNRAASVQITYNVKRQKVTICLGSRCLVSYRYLGESAFDNVSGYGIKVRSKSDSGMLVDNFAIYEGTYTVKQSDIPKKGFNKESAVITEVSSDGGAVKEEVFVSDAVFTNRTFDETDRPEFDGISLGLADNIIEVDASVFTGNKYVKIEKKGEGESYISYGGNSASGYIVSQADFSTDDSTPAGKLMFVRDGNASAMFNTFLNVSASGIVTTNNKVQVAKIEPLKWVNIALAIDVASLTFDVYVNGEMVVEDEVFANKTITGIPLMRTGCAKGSGSGTLLIDNIKVYEGIAPRQLDDTARKSKVTPDSVPQNYLGNLKAVQPYASTYYTDKTKYDAAHEMIFGEDESIVYIHEDDLKAIFGDSVSLSGAYDSMAGYYNLLETAEKSGYLKGGMDTRLLLFNKGAINMTDDQMAEVQRYMFNIRPTANELVELFNNVNKNEHPRVVINATDLERIKTLYKTDPLMKKWGDNVIAKANELFGKPEYKYLISGSSMDDVGTAGGDIHNLCLAYHLTGNERYAARTWKFIENICKLDNWNPPGYLDVGELGYIVAVGYDWLYDTYTQEQRKFIEENLYEKCVNLTRRLYYNELEGNIDLYYTGWWDSEANWNAVCNGGTMNAAIAIFDKYPEVASDMIENANRALEYMMPTYYPEGAWPEGGGYWSYALGYVIRTIETFRNAFGTDFNLAKTPGLDNTGWYGTYLSGSTGWISIGDAGASFSNNPYIMWCATEYQDSLLLKARMIEFDQFGYEGGYNEMLYYDPSLAAGSLEMPLDTFMKGMEVIALREAWYDWGTTFVGASGGSSHRGHGHHDLGSFQIDMAGERFITELGAENYNASGYFAANRYAFYRSRAEGHNMYVINYEDSTDYFGIVKGSSSYGELLVSKPRGSIAKMDLTEPYAPWVTKAIRGYMLSDDRRTVTVRDEIDLIEPNSEVIYSLHTKAKVESIEGGQAVLSLNGKKMLITIETNGTNWSLEEAEAQTMSEATKALVKDTNNASSGGIKKLVFKVTGTGRLNITAKFKQYDDMMSADNPIDGDISTWTIPDGEVTPLPSVDALYIDGTPVEGFDPKITGYSYLVASKETEIPTVTADTNLKYEIIPATEFDGDTLVKVYASGRDDVFRTYRINFWKKPPLQDIDGMRRYPIAKASASDIPEPQNGPDNVFDMDFGTRWAANSIGDVPQWLMLELDDIYPIEKVGLSWMSGDARTYKYKLEISEDGVNWTTVFDGESSGTTAKCEYHNLGGKKAKFVRYTGLGNSINEWNSVTEFEVLGNQR